MGIEAVCLVQNTGGGVEVARLHEGEGLVGGGEGEVISDPTVEETSERKTKEEYL